MNYHIDYDGCITDPGPFHGEASWVPQAYYQFLEEGWAQWREQDNIVAFAPVTANDLECLEWEFDMDVGMFKALLIRPDQSVHGFVLTDEPEIPQEGF